MFKCEILGWQQSSFLGWFHCLITWRWMNERMNERMNEWMNEWTNEWMTFTPAVQTLSKPLLIEDGSRAGAETRPCKITQSESMSVLYLTIHVMLRICYADICMYCVAVIDFLNIAPWTNNPPICSLHRTKLIIVANSTALLTLLLINRGCPQIVKQTLCWFSECLNCILRGNCCHFQEKFKKVYWLVVTGWK